MSEIQQRLDLVKEEALEPERRIIDPHHHFWKEFRGQPYVLEDLWADTESGHNIEQTVFIECGSEYATDGPAAMRPVAETVWVRQLAEASHKDPSKAQVNAIVGHANMMLGAAVEDVLKAQIEAGGGMFRGIRHHATWDSSADVPNSRINPPPHMLMTTQFREGFAKMAPLGLSFESWNYHPQILELVDLARSFPDTTIILNHFGGPIGIGPYAEYKDVVFDVWKRGIALLSECPNVYAKLGGLGMPVNGYGFDTRDKPASSDELVAAHRDFYMHTIDKFGPDRCLFESNYPVERATISYPVQWNAFKKIAAGFSESEKDAMFRKTAATAYRLDSKD